MLIQIFSGKTHKIFEMKRKEISKAKKLNFFKAFSFMLQLEFILSIFPLQNLQVNGNFLWCRIFHGIVSNVLTMFNNSRFSWKEKWKNLGKGERKCFRWANKARAQKGFLVINQIIKIDVIQICCVMESDFPR